MVTDGKLMLMVMEPTVVTVSGLMTRTSKYINFYIKTPRITPIGDQSVNYSIYATLLKTAVTLIVAVFLNQQKKTKKKLMHLE
jgi:hypothetical protein